MSNDVAYDACLVWLRETSRWSTFNALLSDGYDASCDYKWLLAKWQGEPAESVSPAPQPDPVAAPQEVKRYQPGSYLPSLPDDGTGMIEHPRGLYVLHSAYVSLREELDKANSLVESWRTARREDDKWYGKFNEAILELDVQYLGHHYLESATYAAKRAKAAESQLADMRKALEAMLEGHPHSGVCVSKQLDGTTKCFCLRHVQEARKVLGVKP